MDFTDKYSYHKIPEYYAGYFDYENLMKSLDGIDSKLAGIYFQTSKGHLFKAVIEENLEVFCTHINASSDHLNDHDTDEEV